MVRVPPHHPYARVSYRDANGNLTGPPINVFEVLKKLTEQLHATDLNSPEADAIRDEMDLYWHEGDLTPEQETELRAYSEAQHKKYGR